MANERIQSALHKDPVSNYRIYKYLQADNASMYRDSRKVPHSLDYVIGVSPKLQKKVETIDSQGALTYVEWWAYDDQFNEIEEVLRVTINYTYAEDAPTKSARSVISREVTREWIKEDGTYTEGTEKITFKYYDTYRTRKRVGVKRRETIAALGEEGFITLVTILLTGGDQLTAELLGKAILGRFEQDYQLFIDNGSDQFQQDLINDLLTEPIQDTQGNIITNTALPSGISDNDLLSTNVPATINLGQGEVPFDMIVKGSAGKTIRNFMVDHYNGDIV